VFDPKNLFLAGLRPKPLQFDTPNALKNIRLGCKGSKKPNTLAYFFELQDAEFFGVATCESTLTRPLLNASSTVKSDNDVAVEKLTGVSSKA
jgi:hypothetical protein